MSIIDEARYLRSVIEQLSVNLDDEQATEAVALFPAWKVGAEYKIGDRVRYSDVLYKVLQDHTSQADWAPDTAVSLYVRVLIPAPEVIPVWEQPSAENAYMKGDKVYFPTAEDDIYESTIDNNVWSPADYSAGWKLVE